MPIFVLGLVFVIAFFAYYLFSTKSGGDDEPPEKKDDLKTDENVIFLPDDIDEVKKHHKIKR